MKRTATWRFALSSLYLIMSAEAKAKADQAARQVPSDEEEEEDEDEEENASEQNAANKPASGQYLLCSIYTKR